jgi:hypothetical protein
LGIDIHLFVRENKLAAGKAAPFTYHGRVVYQSHQGSQPMSVVFGLLSGGVMGASLALHEGGDAFRGPIAFF